MNEKIKEALQEILDQCDSPEQFLGLVNEVIKEQEPPTTGAEKLDSWAENVIKKLGGK